VRPRAVGKREEVGGVCRADVAHLIDDLWSDVAIRAVVVLQVVEDTIRRCTQRDAAESADQRVLRFADDEAIFGEQWGGRGKSYGLHLLRSRFSAERYFAEKFSRVTPGSAFRKAGPFDRVSLS
jgi:hypothetical protein